MSNEESASDSSNSSSQFSFQDVTDQIFLDNSDTTLIRSGTVVRRPFRNDRIESTSSTEDGQLTMPVMVVFIDFYPTDDAPPTEKYRKEPQYRHSLAAISERRSARNSLSNESGKSMHHSSMDSSSDSTTDIQKYSNKTQTRLEKDSISSISSSYLSWIESVNSEYFGSVSCNPPIIVQEVDNKVGEWNNFWLNYSTARLNNVSTDQTFISDVVEKSTEQFDDDKSPDSTQQDFTEKNSFECVTLTAEERISEILRNSMKRSEAGEGSNESYYSQTISCKNSLKDDLSSNNVKRERSISCVDQSLQLRQKQALKSSQQSSSTSCIDAILNTGVADMFKRVILKRREVISAETVIRSPTRKSFSEWTSR
ncbi:hypothetical protein ABEB36_007482 [Hypothenemus hampei]|uniref:Uncharacterized protein n=1 Tax=Hypothenemus hampei TaxID=57062 RepID=A0ABD1EU50_HYPHA